MKVTLNGQPFEIANVQYQDALRGGTQTLKASVGTYSVRASFTMPRDAIDRLNRAFDDCAAAERMAQGSLSSERLDARAYQREQRRRSERIDRAWEARS